MEISDDKIVDIMLDTSSKVSIILGKLDDHCASSDIKHKSHDKRLTRLEQDSKSGPLDKDFKYWSKKFAPWTLGVSMLGYVAYDIWMKIKGG